MEKRSVLLCAVLAAMLAMVGCGDSSDGDGNGGSGGDGGGGSGGNGSSAQACETLCTLDCPDFTPPDDVQECIDACEQGEDLGLGLGFIFDEECADEAAAFVECYESVDCDDSVAETSCDDEVLDWALCLQDIIPLP